MLERLAHVIVRRRWWVIGVWIVLTIVGPSRVSSRRWFQSFSIPGTPGTRRTENVEALRQRRVPLMIAVFH
jgi:hypothetical protein